MSPFKVHLVVLLKEMIAAYSENHSDDVNTVFNLYLVVPIVTIQCEWLMAFRFFEPIVTLVLTWKQTEQKVGTQSAALKAHRFTSTRIITKV